MVGIILQQAREVREAKGSLSDRTERMKVNWYPVAFWSRSMSPAERNYTIGDQVMLAIVLSYRHL